MYDVRIAAVAQEQFQALPLGIQKRVLDVFARLGHWPQVSGAKPMRYGLKGSFRVRTGDWRVLFTVDEPAKRISVFRIANRRDVYE